MHTKEKEEYRLDLQHLKQHYAQHPHTEPLRNLLKDSEKKHTVQLSGLTQSARALFMANTINPKRINIVLLPTADEAAYFYNDLKPLLPDYILLYYPASFSNTSNFGYENNANDILRTEVIQTLDSKRNKIIIVSYPDALIEKVVSKKDFAQFILTIKVGNSYDISDLCKNLRKAHFEQVDFVDTPGQFALRGSILDIFSMSNDRPFRIDFFDEEVTSIRSFNIDTQLSNSEEKEVIIIPDIIANTNKDALIPFTKLLPKSTIFWVERFDFLDESIRYSLEKIIDKTPLITLNEEEIPTIDLLWTDSKLESLIKEKHTYITFGTQKRNEKVCSFSFNIEAQPKFNKNFDLIITTLQEYFNNGYTNYILSENTKQLKRFESIIEDKQAKIHFQAISETLHQGFVDKDLLFTCFTDHQFFERYYRHKLRSDRYKKAKSGISVSELIQLNIGDYVVHSDHGIGQFMGLHKIDNNGQKQEVIKLIYSNNDILLVNLHSLHKISKYRDKGNEEPKINKLGTATWQNLKKRTKSKIKDIAKDLIALYAKRKEQKGFSFSPDTYLQQELEASFIYEDTPDQEIATEAVKKDMENDIPMDRLVCGDVGFGKTEIAIRGAFKAVADSKQVAVLVPTTILALQHYNTFKDRLKDLPCNIDYISRLRSTKEQREIIHNLKSGKIDIIIGTHKLIGNAIKFKDLGLLIIDEEQRFGVAVKEKLKTLKVNVDTLTLTATPIPRTLQFSLMGARDLSIISTPPPNRQPISTELHGFNDTIIREVILHELNRGGQIFFIHNRVQNIYEMQEYIRKIVPEASSIVGHGQMEGKKLEKNLLDFANGYYDILIATTIIESGLDIPNANTIIINQAHQFGLSELHQLRGRVGRSNVKAFCYLLAPPLQSLTWDARRRLKALEDFSELGSGIHIAMQDLDIRGAGNLLGGEQSGFIADIGYDTYQKILEEAILELRTTEFKDLYSTDITSQKPQEFVTDCHVDTDFEALIPEEYIESTTEKIKLYRELDNISKEEDLERFTRKLRDRFGSIPKETEALMNIVRIRSLAKQMGIERVILKKGILICYLVSDNQSSFYSSPLFSKILKMLEQQILRMELSEKQEKLRLTVRGVKDASKALHIITQMATYCLDK